MAHVSNQAQLAAALFRQEPSIQITADFPLTSQLNILYDVAIESLAPYSLHTLFKDPGYDGFLFRIFGGGALRLANITLDGRSEDHDPASVLASSLICLTDGSLCLDTQSVLKNNSSYSDGGGVRICGGTCCTNRFEMNGSARITGCSSRANGGGAAVSLSSPDDCISISDQAVIDHNSALNGGGLSFTSEIPCLGGTLAVMEQARITDNVSHFTGGGISFSGYRPGDSAPSLLVLDGSVVLSGNTAVHGGAVFFYGANCGDRMIVTDGVTISANTAAGTGGGICCLAPTAGADLLITESAVTGNTAGTGGGIYLLTNFGGAVTFLESRLSDNTAQSGESGSGGGFWFKNTAADLPAVITLNGTEISHNTASSHGGGIAASGQSRLTFLSGSVHDNRSSHYGGGVWLRDRSVFAMKGGEILDNHAVYGGGFYNDTGAALLITGGTVSRNSSDAGGGIYNAEQSSVTLSSTGDFGGEGTNTAALYAPGIYNSGELRAENTRVITNGVYLSSRNSIVRIVGPLAAGSRIQIDGSGYVSPNDAGIPIVIAEAAPPYRQLTETDRESFLKPPSGFDGWEIRLSGDLTQVLLAPPGPGAGE